MFSGTAEIQAFLHARTSPEDRLLVAVSGGMDSVGLLALLADEAGIPMRRLVAGHVNHGIRLDAASDLTAVVQVAGARGIGVFHHTVDARALAREKHLSLEAAARDLRYRALAEMAAESGCKWVLTAHTMDDSAETVLMRMRTGAPWYEWTGIPAKRGNILRPLLTVHRADLHGWVHSKGLPFSEDPTNRDRSFRRNRLRAELASHPDFWNRHQISRLFAAGRDLDAALTAWHNLVYVVPLAVKVKFDAGIVGLAIDEIFRYFNNLTFLPVEVFWAKLTGHKSGRLPSKLRRKIPEFLRGEAPQGMLQLPHGITLLRRGAYAWLFRQNQARVHIPLAIGEWRVPERNSVLVIAPDDKRNGEAGHGVRLRKDVLEHRMVLRNWMPGDRLKAKGRPSKKISDLLREAKLDPLERERVLVLADDAGPLMILGGAVDERAAASDDIGSSIWVVWSEGESIGAGNDL